MKSRQTQDFPYVIFRVKAHKYFRENEKIKNDKDASYKQTSDFYRCKNTDTNFIDYIIRESAGVSKMTIEDEEKISKMMERLAITENDFLGYASKRKGSTGGFDLEGDIDFKKKAEYQKMLQKTKSTVWDGVISFSEDYGKTNCSSKSEALKMLKEIMPKFYQDIGLNPKNVNSFFAFHTNTDNFHVHFCFWEKEPSHINKYGKPIFRPWHIKNLGHFVDKTRLNIMNYYGSNNKERYELFNKTKSAFYQNIVQGKNAAQLKTVYEVLKNNKIKQFNRLSKDKKDVIKDFYNYILLNDPEIKKYHNDFVKSLTREQIQLKKHIENMKNKEGHIWLNTKAVSQFTNTRIKDLELRMCNMILKEVPKLNLKSLANFNKFLKINNFTRNRTLEKQYIAKGKILSHVNRTKINNFSNSFKYSFINQIANIQDKIRKYHYDFKYEKSLEEFLEEQQFLDK